MALRRLQDMGMEKSFTYFELGSDGMILMYIYKNRMVCIASSSAIKSGCRPVKHILLPLDVQNSELGRIDIVNYVQVRCLFEFSAPASGTAPQEAEPLLFRLIVILVKHAEREVEPSRMFPYYPLAWK